MNNSLAKMSARTEFNSMILIDYSRSIDHHRTSFDEECRKIKYEADFASNIVDAGESSLRDLIREDTHKNKLQGKKSLKSHHSSTTLTHEMPPNGLTSKPFSDALEVLSSDKDLIMEFLSGPNCLVHKCSRNLHTSQQSNKTVTLKALLQNGNCSSRQPHDVELSGSVTYFSMREIRRKLKHTFGSGRKEPNSDKFHKFCISDKLPRNRSVFGHDCIYGVEAMSPLRSTTNAKQKPCSKQALKIETKHQTDTARRKIDVSSDRLAKKHGVDVDVEATRDLSTRLNAIGRFISSHETDSFLSPRKESQYCSVSFSPMRSNKEIYDNMDRSLTTDDTDEETQDAVISPNMNGTNKICNSVSDHDTMISNEQRADKIKKHDEYDSLMHSSMDSTTDNGTFSDTADDFPSSPASVNQLDMHDNVKNQEHQSPVSVLDQFFAEECSSASNTIIQSAHNPLKPRRCLHFEEHIASPSQDYTISNYVRFIIRASSLDWDQLAAMRPDSECLLHPSSFDEAQFLMSGPHFDTRLLFNHVNEVLLETRRSHPVSPNGSVLSKPRICCLPLEEAIVDEIMRDAEFYLLPRTQKQTLDQLVAKDFSGSKLQIDTQPETEQIIIHISEDILEESVLDVILQLTCLS